MVILLRVTQNTVNSVSHIDLSKKLKTIFVFEVVREGFATLVANPQQAGLVFNDWSSFKCHSKIKVKTKNTNTHAIQH